MTWRLVAASLSTIPKATCIHYKREDIDYPSNWTHCPEQSMSIHVERNKMHSSMV